MNVTREEDRIILGSREAKCPKCRAPAAVHYATNGRAEFWHSPTDCCDYAQTRERRFDALSRESDHRTRQAHQIALRSKYGDQEAAA